MVEVSFLSLHFPIPFLLLFYSPTSYLNLSNVSLVLDIVFHSTSLLCTVPYISSPATALSSSLTFVACVLAFCFSPTAPALDSTSSPLLSVEGPPPLSYLLPLSTTQAQYLLHLR